MYRIKITDTHGKEIKLAGEEIVVIARKSGTANGVVDADDLTITQAIMESTRLMRAARRAIELFDDAC